ncbi:MAG: ribosomal protein S18 acetylase RimI-like enzyme [Bacteriovoracaceae bacterium]|jgi:ribosomal protein S18 acetylase RimI-like enzyme
MSSSFNLDSYTFSFFYPGSELRGLEEFSRLCDSSLDEAFELDGQFFPVPWPKEKWSQIKKGELGPCLLGMLYKDKTLLGFILFGIGDPDTAHLYKILVSKDLQGSGLGQELLFRSESYLSHHKFISVYLEVEESNLRALAFYQKHGYQVLVKKKGFYGAGRDALALEHILGKRV